MFPFKVLKPFCKGSFLALVIFEEHFTKKADFSPTTSCNSPIINYNFVATGIVGWYMYVSVSKWDRKVVREKKNGRKLGQHYAIS